MSKREILIFVHITYYNTIIFKKLVDMYLVQDPQSLFEVFLFGTSIIIIHIK